MAELAGAILVASRSDSPTFKPASFVPIIQSRETPQAGKHSAIPQLISALHESLKEVNVGTGISF